MSGKIQAVITSFFLGLLFLVCRSWVSPDVRAAEIINEFLDGDYEYSTTWYTVGPDNQKKISGMSEGKKVSSPYQQYEWESDPSDDQEGIEQYWCMKDGSVEYSIKVIPSNYPDGIWITNSSPRKGSDLYVREDMSFDYARMENISGKQAYVYSSQYEDEIVAGLAPETGESGNSHKTIRHACVIKIEYYLDFASNEVKRIVIDESDAAKVSEIVSLMMSGLSQSDAEETVEKEIFYESAELVMEIRNFNGDITIHRPEDLTEVNTLKGSPVSGQNSVSDGLQ